MKRSSKTRRGGREERHAQAHVIGPLRSLCSLLLLAATSTQAFQYPSQWQRRPLHQPHPRQQTAPVASLRGLGASSPRSRRSRSSLPPFSPFPSTPPLAASSTSFQPLRPAYDTNSTSSSSPAVSAAAETVDKGSKATPTAFPPPMLGEEELLVRGPPPPAVGPMTKVSLTEEWRGDVRMVSGRGLGRGKRTSGPGSPWHRVRPLFVLSFPSHRASHHPVCAPLSRSVAPWDGMSPSLSPLCLGPTPSLPASLRRLSPRRVWRARSRRGRRRR